MFEAKLSSADEYKLGDSISIRFDLKNTSDTNIYILPWYTPLEGLVTPCLEVKCNGQKIDYDGAFLKRPEPHADDFQLIKPSETLSKQFDLAYAYPIRESGTYEVSLDTRILFLLEDEIRYAKELEEGDKSSSIKTNQLKLDNANTSFIVRAGEEPLLTIGEQERTEYGISTRSRWLSAEEVKGMSADQLITIFALPPILINSTDQTKIDLVTRLHNDAYQMSVDAAIRYSRFDGSVLRWFGNKWSTGKSGGGVTAIWSVFNQEQLTYDLAGIGCPSTSIAWVVLGSRLVHLCNRFWGYNDTPPNSRRGIIYHELSHATSKTLDHLYGVEECLELARTDSITAQDNADNYQYFGENV